MKVYILKYDNDWEEAHHILGAYSSFEKATEAKREYIENGIGEGILGIAVYELQ